MTGLPLVETSSGTVIEVVTVQVRRCKLIAVALAAATVLIIGGARADDEGKRKRRDHEVARDALTSGEIRPLEAIIAEVRRTMPGDIVGIELEKYSGHWVYKIKVISPSGTMQRVQIDARGSATPSPPATQHAPVAPAHSQQPAADVRSR